MCHTLSVINILEGLGQTGKNIADDIVCIIKNNIR